MKWTEFFIPTAKESLADATVPSHQLMIRAGLIRQVVAGAYTYLPFGYRCLRKIEAIVREEMNRAGAIELHMPTMHPFEWWEQTGRAAPMGRDLGYGMGSRRGSGPLRGPLSRAGRPGSEAPSAADARHRPRRPARSPQAPATPGSNAPGGPGGARARGQ